MKDLERNDLSYREVVGIVFKIKNVWEFIFWLYCMSYIYRKKKRESREKEMLSQFSHKYKVFWKNKLFSV